MNIYNSILKLLTKYKNKTYTNKKYSLTSEQGIDVKIKIEICKIFDYLLDWREDYVLDNLMDYFTTKYQN